MRTDLRVIIASKAGGARYVWRTIDLSFAPQIGMRIEDPAFHRNSIWTVKDVLLSINPDGEPSLVVYLGEHEVDSSDQTQEVTEMYKAHGWIDSSKIP